MENYLRVFDTESEYESVKDDLVYPTVSYTVDTDKLWFIKRVPSIQNQVKMVFSITEDDVNSYGGEMMQAWGSLYRFDSVTVDGVEQVSASEEYDVNVGVQDSDEFKLTDESFIQRPVVSLTINFNEPLNPDSNIAFAFREKWEEDGELVVDSWIDTLDDTKEYYNSSIITTQDGRISSIIMKLGWEYDEYYQLGVSVHTYADDEDPYELIPSKDNVIDINIKYTSGNLYLYLPTTETRDYEVVATIYSNVTSMSYMFNMCERLTSLDLSSLDTSNVTNMNYMFANCRGLTSLDLSSLDTSNVTNMSWMFVNCSGLTSLDLSHFDTSNVISMNSMFYGCESLTSVTMINNVSSETYVTDMFKFINTTGTFYYNADYDYSNIIAVLPSTWTAVDPNGGGIGIPV